MRILMIVLFTAGVAAADPSTDPVVTPGPLVLQTTLFSERTPTVVPSLRLEAARVASERYQDNWRYPEPGAIAGYDGAGWYFGAGHYRPRTRRSAALHGGSMAATMLGEILLATDSPLAGFGALVSGATLDAAGADADRDAEAAQPKR